MTDKAECWTCDKMGDGYPGTVYFRQAPRDTCYERGHDVRPVKASTCLAHLAYRDMADIGSPRVCGNPAGPSGLCKRHDPETAPKRDAKGRILPKPVKVSR
jgi:hypothetical protein